MTISDKQMARLEELSSKTSLSDAEMAEVESLSSGSISQTDAERNSSMPSRGARNQTPYMPGMDFPMVAGQMADATQEDRVAARGMTDAGLRYGLPIAAGLVAAPFTGGMSIAGSMALLSGIGAGSSAVGSTLAELMQQEVTGKPMSGREILSDTISGATPFKAAGSLIGRTAFNVTSNLFSSEIARKARMGEDYTFKSKDTLDAMTRWGLPVSLGGIMSFAGKTSSNVIEAGVGRKAYAERYFNARPDLLDVFPSLKNENGSSIPNYRYARQAAELEYGNKVAQELFDNKSIPIEKVIEIAFPNVQDISGIATDLGKKVGQLRILRTDQEQAVAAFNKASELAESVKNTGTLEYPGRLATAREAALDVVRKDLLFTEGKTIMFGGVSPDLGSAAAGVRDKAIAAAGLAARNASDSAIDQLYLKAGVGENTPVVYLPTVLRKIDEMTGPGKTFAGAQAAKEVRDEVIAYFAKPSAAYGGATDNNTLTLEQFKRLQQSIADKLSPGGVKSSAAEKISSETYHVVKEASADFFKNSRPEIAEAWTTAQDAYAAQSKARGVGAIDLINEGKSDEFFELLLTKGGISNVFEEFNHYAEVIAATADRANPQAISDAARASQLFKEGINNVVRNTLVDRASDIARGSGFKDSLTGFNLGKLLKDLQTLKTRNFDISVLGFGTLDEIAALSRTQLDSQYGGYTVAQANQFFNELPLFGADVAAHRINHDKAITASMLLTGRKQEAAQRDANFFRAKSRYTAAQAGQKYNEAAANPLVKLLDGSGMKLSNDVVNNIDYIDRLLELGPKTAKGFTEAMEAVGEGANLATIRAAAPARVMRVFLPNGGANARIDIVQIREFFYGKDLKDINRRETLKAIMDPGSYESLVDRIVSPINDILEGAATLGKPIGSTTLKDFGNIARAQGRTGTGSGAGVTFRAGIPLFLEMYSKADYKVMNLLYINERFAPKFSAAGYNVDKFVANNSVNAVALKLAQDEDAAAKAAPRK